ncbi:MAG: hypothetical protein JWQ38_2163 [Flavipsychrobacter sp.]|nr:hypothetical protein [Flavipsychrobacter sp.]
MKSCVYTLLLLLSTVPVFAQNKDDLFAPGIAPDTRHGFILNGNAAFDMPGGDMAKRFGNNYRLGPALLYKTSANWLFGAKFDFIIGSKIKEDSLMFNIRDKYSATSGQLYEFINSGGERIGVPVYERGYAVGVNAGKIFNFSKNHPDNGLVLLTTVGFIQHRINIYDKDKSVNQLRGDYIKGYDRLTNGSFIEQYVGYMYFSDSRLVNFTIGIDALFGFTQGRRDYLYDVRRADTKQRVDMLFGLRGGWFIPIFKRKSEDLLFE